MTSSKPYQGFPYVNVSYTDAPSIGAGAANQWANLPVRTDGTGGVRSPLDANRRPKVNNSSQDETPPKKNIDDVPVVYIDIPSNENHASIEQETTADEGRRPSTVKPDVIQDTVYYNPYGDQTSSNNPPRIESSVQSYPDPGASSSSFQQPRDPPRNVNRPGYSSASSSGAASNWAPQPSYPPYMSKEAEIYSPSYPRPQGDGLMFEPLPEAEFPTPVPPPAYSEVDHSAVTVSPGPTQIIVNTTYNTGSQPTVIPVNPYRKIVVCPHCGARVSSIVIKQNGPWTHGIALSLLLCCLLPFTFLIYFLDMCKYKNHYCPNCNELIGHEICCKNTVDPK